MVKHFASVSLLLMASAAQVAAVEPGDWAGVEAAARGQSVYFHAWGGEPRINDYIDWAAGELADRYGVTLRHVKVSDIAETVSRILAEKAAGRTEGGSVDLLWINGENFASMKANGLLHGPWTETLPNYRYVDADNPAVRYDFTVPVEGMEAPWGMAQVVFNYDTAEVPLPPRSAAALLAWAKENPGRFTYPQPPNFLGTTFLKQVLIGLVADPDRLRNPVGDDFEALTAPLWDYLDKLHPVLWRGGRAFPRNGSAQRPLMADGEIAIAISFNPAEASRAIASGELPDTVRTYVFEGGTIGNANFLAIPFNANAKAGALVVANYLLSPKAQARKQDPELWGGGTVLDLVRLSAEDRARFEALELGIATLSPQQLGPPLPEPHPSWIERIEAEWQRRFGVAN